MIIKSPVSELVIIPDAGAYKEGLKNARKFIGHKRVRVMSLDHFKKAGKGKDVNEIGWDLVKPTQYDFEYLTSTRWYRLMRQA